MRQTNFNIFPIFSAFCLASTRLTHKRCGLLRGAPVSREGTLPQRQSEVHMPLRKGISGWWIQLHWWVDTFFRHHRRWLMETCCFLLKDANECLERGGERGHHCNMNTRCVNVYGSYKCECLPGYVRSDKWNCVEVNECATGQHSCDENSICTNTEGSYNCSCKPGYAADGSRCVPVCDPHCLNGGVCVAPNKCECRSGWVLTSMANGKCLQTKCLKHGRKTQFYVERTFVFFYYFIFCF